MKVRPSVKKDTPAEASTKERARVQGTIEEVLPSALFRVRLADGRAVSAGLSPSLRQTVVRAIAGERVAVEISSRDPSRGQIVKKL
jgi:translation initiation factor IF-1